VAEEKDKPAEQKENEEQAPKDDAPAAAAPKEELPPIIVIKKIIDEGHAGAHGGAWKIALADMMTAMMAFFLLMWLLGATSEDQRKSIADYFRPTTHSQVRMGELAGSNGILGGSSIIDPDGFKFTAKQTALLERMTPRSEAGPDSADGSSEDPQNREGKSPEALSQEERKKIAAEADRETFEKLEKEIKEEMKENKQLAKLMDQIQFVREKEGLRIEIIDKADFSMFPLGSNRLEGRAAQLLTEIAASLAGLPNKIAIRGHTDSLPYAPGGEKNNWTLSTERAEATRQQLQRAGLKEDRFAKIEGVADKDPYVPQDPADPRNRRMSITVLYQNPQ
jgi:chemotaxis protein MotB